MNLSHLLLKVRPMGCALGGMLLFCGFGLCHVAAASGEGSTLVLTTTPSIFSREVAATFRSGGLVSRDFGGSVLAQQWDEGARAPTSESFKAIAYSAILPGLAQWKLGHQNRALGFWVAEAAFWTGFTSYRVQGNLREDSYLEMATLFAGVADVESRDDDYLRRIASWPSSDLYDELITRRNARTFSGDDPVAREEYFQANRIPRQDQWSWESSAARNRFSDKRSDSNTAFKRSRAMLGLALANRVVAMIDAVILSNQQSDSAYHLRMEPHRSGEHWEGRLSLSRSYH